MKTLLITTYNTFISRNILNTEVLRLLTQKSDLRIVIFCPPHKVDLFKQYYGHKNVVFEGLDMEPIIRKPWNKKLYRLAFLLENSQYVKDQRLERYWNNRNVLGYLNYLWVSGLSCFLSSFRFFFSGYRFFDYYFSDRRVLGSNFNKYNPDFVFATDSFGEMDVWFMKEARARKVPLITMVRSWDNTTTKGMLRVVPDEIIVNSPVVKNELIQFHGCRSENVFVAGLPQFDSWLSGPTESRDQFFSKIGADHKKRLILFAPAGKVLSDTDWQICQILKESLENGFLPNNIQFLVRNHPQHPADLSRFVGDNSFIIENPGFMIKDEDRKNVELKPEEGDHLRNSIYYSDVVMYVATSLGIDASIYNKPQILISFDGWEKRPYIRSVRRYNAEDCLGNLVKCGGTSVVNNREELVAAINNYFKNPALDQAGRDVTIKQHLYKIDGGAGKRIANFILDFMTTKK